MPTDNNPYFRILSRPVKRTPLLSAVGEMLKGSSPESSPQAEAAPIMTATPQHPALTVLLVEDNAMNRKVAVRMLEKLGHRVLVAENGRQAIEAFKTSRTADPPGIDVILMDGQMPEMDGIQATREIRLMEAEGMKSRIPVIAITANAMKGDKERFLAAGMDGYIAKPMKQKDIAMEIERLTPTHTSPPPAAPAVDIDDLLDIMDNDRELLAQWFGDFLTNHKGHLEGIETSIASGDAAALNRRAHRFKGYLKYLAAHRAAEAAFALERAAGERRLAGAEALLLQLAKECEAVKMFIEDFDNEENFTGEG